MHMLINRQRLTLFACNDSCENSGSSLPSEVMGIIKSQQERATHLLKHVAYGDLTNAKAMLEDDPTLLLST